MLMGIGSFSVVKLIYCSKTVAQLAQAASEYGKLPYYKAGLLRLARNLE